ncbi:hypothetical protein, conserved [Leishmania donovani]|uniref:BBSome complex member BBS5 PH domain-containing protein n=1 Tax=Leishmania donovani TaxID=5661 RepID=A0A3Q8ICM0_LEIDO|nr:hypothetical protein, conserved [Leishmania donovani]AYU76980.1 Protein of unknown function (DUF1448), putative [Leishmania donovani]TPP53914.1 hypothetical protein CGC21_27465 [Leishmania donovani]CBZ32468.1 hypothetical protein, conserved [Leishmania donovani]
MRKRRGGGASSPSGTGRGITKAFAFWQDREIHFDAAAPVLRLRENTEHVYATFDDVEDTKGNNGCPGTLLVTNLRLIWRCKQRPNVNLSIGYYCVHKLTVQEAESKLAGRMTECITLGAKCGASRFQFIFSVAHNAGGIGSSSAASVSTSGGAAAQRDRENRSRRRPSNSTGDHQRLYATIRAVWNAYESTRVYRELRVRSAVVQHGNLILLDGENVISRTSGVSSVSKDEGHLGTFIVTNIRVVWFAAAEFFNVSVPYLQFVGLRSQMSKFGQALVIETSSYAGNFVLGFRVDPEEKLNEMYAEISTLWRTWTARPLLGMKVELHDDTGKVMVPEALGVGGGDAGDKSGSAEHPHGGGLPGAASDAQHERQMEGQNVLQEVPTDALAAYYAGGGRKGEDRRPVYEPSIGLAVEKLRKGTTIQSLWDTSISS